MDYRRSNQGPRESEVGLSNAEGGGPRIALALAEFAEGVLLPAMPQYGFAEHHAKRHRINQRPKRRTLAPRAMKINVRPRPEMPVPVTAIVPLHSKA